MDAALEYVAAALTRSWWQLAIVFGGVGVLAVLLWCVSTLLRKEGSGLLGRFYYYLVAPGVACHETGHALGCLLTGSKIVKFVPLHPQGDTLGYVTHERRGGVFGWFAELAIATGPVWFACALVPALACIFAGIDFLPRAADHLAPGAEGVPAYAAGVFGAACEMACAVFRAGSWRSPWFALALYFVFCITSEATLSGSDLKSAWKGFAGVAALVFAANLIPGAGGVMSRLAAAAAPWLFPVHALMMFVLLADMVFWVLALSIHRLFSLLCGRRRQ